MNRNIPLVVGITILFLGLAVQPSIATLQPEVKTDVETKNYLFQTIIDITNNPEVKNLFEQYKYDLFKVDIDRSVYRKIFFRNPRVLFQLIFTKPSMSHKYLNFAYNQGIKITSIIGEDKAFELIESIKVTDTKLFDELNDIIVNNEELSDRLVVLEEMDKEYVSDLTWDYSVYEVICNILWKLLIASLILYGFILLFDYMFNQNSVISRFLYYYIEIPYIYIVIAPPFLLYFKVFECEELPWY